MSESVTVTLTQKDNYQFVVDFGDALPTLLADEPPPLGEGTGPAPTHMLLAAVANCLSASLLFSLRKFKQDPGQLTATATCDIGRNAENRLRVLGIRVEMTLAKPADSMEHLDRILTQFEAFCTVSQSVQAGVPVSIGVTDGLGQRLR
ncbi:OsmC family protein [Paludibacterium denitrificans]|uniref:OsmC family peroxiredoxin n=1 Tax=Paludibacterium denitrificans TaxID=2675226 RepID=A0A844GBK7_9NEIS|nr:OsmC family protein [Paludibacterium denitrificans]MTD33019.1 OsmC family peroxiredoxin [Paludibacterium denitrificans]HJV05982.1 OsmC family protein [Chromobacteriaceae bacterium]